MSIVTAVAVVTVIGLLGAAILVVAAHFMHVEEDPRVGEVLGVLPGANCGACGYAGCADYAKAIVEGAPVNKCARRCKMCGRGCSHHGRGSGRSCEAQGYRSLPGQLRPHAG